MKPRFKAGDRVILVGNQKLWGTPGIDVSSSLYRTIPPGTPGTVDENDSTTPFVRFDGFGDRYCLHQKWLVPESPSAEDIFVTLPGCDAAPTEDDTANMGLPPDTQVTFIAKCRTLYAGRWWVRRADNNMPRIIGPKWLRLVETDETKENLDRFHHFSIPEKTKEAAPTVELWAVSPGVEIPRSIFGCDFKCSDPTLLQITVDAGGKRTFVRCFIFGTDDAAWHMLNGHVRLVDIDSREALGPYLPKVTQLTRAEIAKKLGIDNLEIVD